MFRVTMIGTSRSMLNYILNGESKYYDLSEQSASGLKVSEPSDDPFATKSILDASAQISKLNNYLDNMSISQNELDVFDDTMSSLTNLIEKATDLTTQAPNGTFSNEDMDYIKEQIDTIIQSVMDLANMQYNGNYIFSGTAAATQTYVADPLTGNITYQGTPSTGSYQRYTTISDGISVAINTTGDQIFGSYQAFDNNGTPGDLTDDTPEVAVGLLGTLAQISRALGNHDKATVSACLDGLNDALDTTSVNRTKFASISNRFQITQDSINSTITQLKAYKSDLQNADLSEVLSSLTAQETSLQATYAITSKLMGGSSLLDYL